MLDKEVGLLIITEESLPPDPAKPTEIFPVPGAPGCQSISDRSPLPPPNGERIGTHSRSKHPPFTTLILPQTHPSPSTQRAGLYSQSFLLSGQNHLSN